MKNALKNLSQFFIIYFREVTSVKTSSHRIFALMQKMIRDKMGFIRICGLHPNIKKEFLDSGIVKDEEICDNIRTATAIFELVKFRKT